MSEPRELALFPLDVVLFPGGPLTLRIFEPRYLDMVSRCMRENCGFAVVLRLEADAEAGTQFVATGTEARIVDFDRLKDGLLGISCLGQQRVRVLEAWAEADGLMMGTLADIKADAVVPVPEAQSYLAEIVGRVIGEMAEGYQQVLRQDDAAWIGNRLAEMLPLSRPEKQALLEMTDPIERLLAIEGSIRRDEG